MSFLNRVANFFRRKKLSRVLESRRWELLMQQDGKDVVIGEFYGTEPDAFEKAQEVYVNELFRSEKLQAGGAIVGQYGIRLKR